MTELILTIGALHLLVPLGLLFWQWRERSPSKIQWLVKTILTGAYLSAVAVAGLWIWVPFFVSYLYLGASLLLAVRGWLRVRALPFWRAKTVWARSKFGLTALLAVLVSGLAIYTVSGWRVPAGDVARLSFPLKDGTFHVVNGGSNSLLNAHLATLGGEHFRPFRGQSYAVDIVQINRFGLRANGLQPADPAQYAIFGSPVYAPCAGTVIGTENGREDMSPPQTDRANLTGNHVLLGCGDFLVLLAHFKKGSVVVSAGQTVEAGQRLGQVGNSGNTGEPHLHIHAQRRGTQPTSLNGEPVWMIFDGAFLVRNQIISL